MLHLADLTRNPNATWTVTPRPAFGPVAPPGLFSSQAGDRVFPPGNYLGTGRQVVAFLTATGRNRSQNEWRVFDVSGAAPGGPPTVVSFGLPGDVPVPGDYDGTGAMRLAVFRPADNTWHVLDLSANQELFSLSSAQAPFAPGDYPLPPALYQEAGIVRRVVALYRPTAGQWFLVNLNGILQDTVYAFPGGYHGYSTDLPAPGDYSYGNGTVQEVVFRGGFWSKPDFTVHGGSG
jgi:hypothetical protein